MGQQTNFTTQSKRSGQHEFSFSLVDDGWKPYPFAVIRHGVSVVIDGVFGLSYNPEDLIREYPARSTVNQTPHGAWVDSFGPGLPRWTIRGTTGLKVRGSTVMPDGKTDGYLDFHAFHDIIETYFLENRRRVQEAARGGSSPPKLLRLIFRDFRDDEEWQIEPDGMPTKSRSKDRSLWITYQFSFTGVRNVLQKQPVAADSIGEGIAGGPERDKKIADAHNQATADVDAGLNDLDEAVRTDPASGAALNSLAPDKGGDWIGWVRNNVVSPAQQLGSAVTDYVTNAKSFIDAPLKMAQDAAGAIRQTMDTITGAVPNIAGTALRQLRLLRARLRALLCSIQSLLSFPHNFVKSLRDIMQGIFDLFRLSGCATTFPSIKPLSWQPSIRTNG